MKTFDDKNKAMSVSHSQCLALESRLVFDGAAVATVVEVQTDLPQDQKVTEADNAGAVVAPDTSAIDSSAVDVHYQANDNVDTSPTFFVDPIDSSLVTQSVSGVSGEYSSTLIVVDPRAETAAALLAKPPLNAQVVVLDVNKDGFQQIESLLQQRGDVKELHVVTGSEADKQWLGNKSLSSVLDTASTTSLTHWGDDFTQDAQIIFHGVHHLGSTWLGYVDALTGADSHWSLDSDLVNPVQTGLFVLSDASYSYSNTLNAAETLAQNHLSAWFEKTDVLSQLAIPFSAKANTSAWTANALALRDAILNGGYSIRLDVRSSAEMDGVLGAYSAIGTTNQATIYLNADWLMTATPEAVEAVLLEELGHSFDDVLNGGVDSQGDEGHAFVGLVLYNDANLAANLQDMDHGAIRVDNQTVTIEKAAPYGIAQSFFVPMKEADVKTSLSNIDGDGIISSTIQTVLSIVSTDNSTVIVYDHWEDGYEADLKNPIQSTTLIWGDGNNANGIAPGFANDPTGIPMGKVITLINTVDTTQTGSLSPTSGTMAGFAGKPYFDGRDLIGATKAIAVTKAGWAIDPGTVLAGAVNLYDSGNAGSNYVIPMGENTVTASPDTATTRLFEYTSLHIIANENNTKVTIDKDGTGAGAPITVTLNKGETYLVNGGVLQGATITSSDSLGTTAIKPIEVYAIAGDKGSTYENRWFAITPKVQWSNSYYAPVATTLSTEPAYVFLYNDNASSIRVYYDTQTTTGNFIDVPAYTSKYVEMPASAAHFYTKAADGSPKFYAIGTIDSNSAGGSGAQARDWSYSLVPEAYLTSKFVVAWGPGYDNTSGTIAGVKNASPVWVTSPTATTLYIDMTGDGFNNGVNGDYTYNIKALESYRITDPSDKNQSGLTVYTTDGTLITAAWGEDPSIADAGSPYLDLGTTVMPFPDYVFKKSSKEATTVTYGSGVSNDNSSMELGEQIEYTISLTNRAVIDLYNINIKDYLTPTDSATYLPNSAKLTLYNPDGTVAWVISDLDGSTQLFPLNPNNNSEASGLNVGYTIGDTDSTTPGVQGLQRGYSLEFKYRVTVRNDISKALADTGFVISNTAKMTSSTPEGDPIIRSVTNNTKLNVPFTDGEVFFYNSAFTNIASAFNQNDAIGLQVVDGDQNKSATQADTLQVIVTNLNTGLYETVTLTETGVNTGIFRSTPLITNTTDTVSNNGVLGMVNFDNLKVEYTDPASGTFADNPNNPGINAPNYNVGLANLKTAIVGTPPAPTDGLLQIFDSAAYTNVKTQYQEGDTLYLRVSDGDQNLDSTKAETIKVVVTNSSTGESETVTLTETGANTGIFTAQLSTTANNADKVNNSGVLKMAFGESIKAEYTDPIWGILQDNPSNSGPNTNRVTGAITKTKVLYLSGSGDLDRIDPVATNDVTTSQTAAINPVIGNNATYRDNFATVAYNNSNGTESWTSSWTETNDTNNNVQIDLAQGLNIRRTSVDPSNPISVQRALDLSSADTTQAITLSFDATYFGSMTAAGEGVTLRISTDNGVTFNPITTGTLTVTANGEVTPAYSTTTGLFTGNDASGATPGAGTFTVDIKSLVAASANKNNIVVQFYGTNLARGTANTPFFAVDNFQVAFTKSTAATPATFTQNIAMADTFSMPVGGSIKVVTHISSVTGSLTGANIKANLTYGAGNTVIANLSSPVYDSAAGTLTWIGSLPSSVNIAAGEAIKLVVNNEQSGVSFKVDYDSNTKPSRIELPTTTVIKIVDVDGNSANGVQQIGFYDNSFASGGNLITNGSVNAGAVVYVRVKVADPFGDYDITGLNLTINDPSGNPVTLSGSPTVIDAAGDGLMYKTYEYAWQTVNTTGSYNIKAVAQEGYESITATVNSSLVVSSFDLGTPSITQFITGLIGADAGPQYTAGSNAFLRITDLDENTNATTKQTVTAVVNGITVTLTETGVNTGIFEADLSLQNAAFSNLAAGTVLTANYVDRNDASDISGDTIFVPTPSNTPPTLDLDTTNNNSVNHAEIFNENGAPVSFVKDSAGIPIGDNLTAMAWLTLNIPTASITDGTSEQLLINGATSGGTIALNFVDAASINNVVLGGVTYSVTATVSGGNSILKFAKSGGGNLTIAETEALLEALRYNNNSENPTDANRVFTLQVNDGDATTPLNSNTATFTVNVNHVNDPPVIDLDANNSSTATGADYKTSFTENGAAVAIADSDVSITDVDSTMMSSARIILTNPIDGALESLSVSGVLPAGISASTYNPATGVITLTGSASLADYQTAIRQIVYNNTSENPSNTSRIVNVTVNDGIFDSNIAATTITITPENDPPVAKDNNYTASENTLLTGKNIITDNTGAGIDSDVEGDTLTISKIGAINFTANGTDANHLAANGWMQVSLPNGTLFIKADGTMDYMPATNDNTGDTFTYTITDSNGGTSTATVVIGITPFNDPPVVDLDTSTTGYNHSATFTEMVGSDTGANAVNFTTGATNLTDIDSTTLSNLSVSIPVASIQTGDQLRLGSTVINITNTTATGEVLYNGTYFKYNITDNAGTRTISFNSLTGTGGTVSTAVLASYEALIDALKYNSSSDTPSGSRTFGVSIKDNLNLISNVADFTVNITAANDPPVAKDNSYTATEDTLLTGKNIITDNTGVGIDSDAEGDTLTISKIGAINFTANGTDANHLGANGWMQVSLPNGTLFIKADGTMDYMPVTNNIAGDTFTYTITDSNGDTSTATVVIQVKSTEAPIAANDSQTGIVGQAVTVKVTNNDTDANNNLDPSTVRIVGSVDGKTLVVAGQGTWTVSTTGEITFTPQANFTGQPTAIQYTVSDTTGLESNQATVTVTYLQTAPTAQNDSARGATGQTVTVNVVGNDTDPENDLDPSTVRIVGSVDGKTLVVAGQGTWTVNASGQIIFTPELGFKGDPSPIKYTVKDKAGLESNSATVSIDYPQSPPVATPDNQTGTTGQPLTINVLGNDLDVDNDIDPRSVKILGATNNSLFVFGQGTWSVDSNTGAITFTPQAGFTGSPTPIQYTVKDKTGLESNPATVRLNYPLSTLFQPLTPGSIIMLSNTGRGLLADYVELDKKQWNYDFKFHDDFNLPLPHLSLYVPLGRHVIDLRGELRDQLVLELQPYSFSIPRWAFRHTDPNEQLEFEASRPDGTPLPDWLKFDARSLKFSGTPPRGAYEQYVMVTVRDSYGNEVHATFTVRVEKECGKETGKHCDVKHLKNVKPKIKVHEKPTVAKAGLSEQVSTAGKLSKLQESRALLDSLKQL